MRNALRLFARNLKKARALFRVAVRLHQVERVLDGFERIVDLMRDGGREATDRREFLRLEKLLLDAPSLKLAYLCQVMQNRDDSRHLSLRVYHLARSNLHRQRLARLRVNQLYLRLPVGLGCGSECRDK